MVIPVLGDAVAGVGARDVDSWADVADLAVGVGELAEVAARVGVGVVGDGPELVDGAELGQGQGAPGVLEEGVALADCAGVLGDEDRAFVGVVAEDGGDFDEAARGEEVVEEVWDEVSVYGWAV